MGNVNSPTAKQLAFARAVIRGDSPIDAYTANYNCENMKRTTAVRKATELRKHPAVSKIIETSQAKALALAESQLGKDMAITLEGQTRKLQEIIDAWREYPNPSFAVSAINEQNKLHGLLIERKLLDVRGGVLNISGLPQPDPPDHEELDGST